MSGCIPETVISDHPDAGVLSISGVTVADNALDKRNNNNIYTRAGGGTISPDDFIFTITELATGIEIVRSRVAEADKLYTLPSGEYALEIASPWEAKDFAWSDQEGAFSYRTVRNFTIAQDKITELGNVECAVSNIVVSVRLSENMQKVSEGLNWTASVGLGSFAPGVEFDFGPRTVEKMLYFRAENALNTLVWDFTGEIYSYPPVDKNTIIPVGGHAFIKDVKAGEHRVLTFDVTGKGGAQMGNLEIMAECETYEIGLDVAGEEDVVGALPVEIKLPEEAKWVFDTPADAPNKVFYSDIFDKEGVVVTPLAMEVLVPKGIAAMSLTFTTNNAALEAELAARGLDGTVDLTEANEALTQLGLPGEVGGVKILPLDLTEVVRLALDTFGIDGSGRLDIAISATAPSGEGMTKMLAMNVIENSTAELWVEGVGFDVKERLIITAAEQATTPVVVHIVASQGIQNLWVAISSTNPGFDEAYAGIGFDKPFDLVNPGALEGSIDQLGLPYGEQTQGTFPSTKPLVFDISAFIPLMFMFPGEFDADFGLTVVDINGASTTETIKVGIRE